MYMSLCQYVVQFTCLVAIPWQAYTSVAHWCMAARYICQIAILMYTNMLYGYTMPYVLICLSYALLLLQHLCDFVYILRRRSIPHRAVLVYDVYDIHFHEYIINNFLLNGSGLYTPYIERLFLYYICYISQIMHKLITDRLLALGLRLPANGVQTSLTAVFKETTRSSKSKWRSINYTNNRMTNKVTSTFPCHIIERIRTAA